MFVQRSLAIFCFLTFSCNCIGFYEVEFLPVESKKRSRAVCKIIDPKRNAEKKAELPKGFRYVIFMKDYKYKRREPIPYVSVIGIGDDIRYFYTDKTLQFLEREDLTHEKITPIPKDKFTSIMRSRRVSEALREWRVNLPDTLPETQVHYVKAFNINEEGYTNNDVFHVQECWAFNESKQWIKITLRLHDYNDYIYPGWRAIENKTKGLPYSLKHMGKGMPDKNKDPIAHTLYLRALRAAGIYPMISQ